MLRTWIAIVWLAVVGAQFARADQFVLKDANAVAAACKSQDYLDDNNCYTYVIAVSEMYFLSNPSCARPDFQKFMGAVMKNIIASTRGVNSSTLASETSANVVYQAIAKAHPCQIAEKSNVPDSELCRAGFAVLNNAWANQLQRQSAIEILRNRGCLN